MTERTHQWERHGTPKPPKISSLWDATLCSSMKPDAPKLVQVMLAMAGRGQIAPTWSRQLEKGLDSMVIRKFEVYMEMSL